MDLLQIWNSDGILVISLGQIIRKSTVLAFRYILDCQ